jgi:predicted NUDIX family NTP pyrophosphohydrolase
MAIQSAGLLVYRKHGSTVEVLLVHPGGPLWAKKDMWSIPKGETEAGEDLQMAAAREFKEELGFEPPSDLHIELGHAKQNSSKIIYVWAIEGDPDLSGFVSNTFSMEWPPKSGKQQEFPENDRVAWWPLSEAKQKVFKAQQSFLDRLAEQLHVELSEPPQQQSLL